jgi:dihydrofolate reductase
MRKLKLQVQISVDGFIAGPNGEMNWMTWTMDEDFTSYVNELTDSSDTILLGRKLAEGFIPYWSSVAANPQDPQYPFGKKMSDLPKVVFSKTVKDADWANTEVANGDLVSEVNKLKNAKGKDIIVYGGAGFVSSLIKEGLIDELHLFVNPTALGHGLPIFKEVESALKLKLVKALPLNSGIVILCYSPTA